MPDEIYDREVIRDLVRGVARDLLSGEFTTETVEWEDGDYRITAFHTIDATYPFAAEARDEEHGLPFYREQVTFSTTDDDGWVYREVVRRTCGETGERVVDSTPVAWAGPKDPRTDGLDDELYGFLVFDKLLLSGDGPVGAATLGGLDLKSIALVPSEEALEGNRIETVEWS